MAKQITKMPPNQRLNLGPTGFEKEELVKYSALQLSAGR
jgi:hypothetical protein